MHGGDMLEDAREREIISQTCQGSVRDPDRSRRPFENIFYEFFRGVDFKKKRLLDLGPGHFDFGVMARGRGASTVVGFDKDAAVLKLGKYKGFEVVEGNLRRVSSEMFPQRFDGVFSKFSLNCFWFWKDEQRHKAHVDSVCDLATDTGWAWIAPWNGAPKQVALSSDIKARTLEVQRRAFEERGFLAVDLSEFLARWYGVNGAVENNVLYIKNLQYRPQINRIIRFFYSVKRDVLWRVKC